MILNRDTPHDRDTSVTDEARAALPLQRRARDIVVLALVKSQGSGAGSPHVLRGRPAFAHLQRSTTGRARLPRGVALNRSNRHGGRAGLGWVNSSIRFNRTRKYTAGRRVPGEHSRPTASSTHFTKPQQPGNPFIMNDHSYMLYKWSSEPTVGSPVVNAHERRF